MSEKNGGRRGSVPKIYSFLFIFTTAFNDYCAGYHD